MLYCALQMRIHAVFVVFAISVALARGQKLSYADNPNNYHCEDEVIEYTNPIPTEHRARTMKSSYSYYNPQASTSTKYIWKYPPVKKYYTPPKKDSRFYEAFQSAGQRAYEQTVSGGHKAPAIQIYVV